MFEGLMWCPIRVEELAGVPVHLMIVVALIDGFEGGACEGVSIRQGLV